MEKNRDLDPRPIQIINFKPSSVDGKKVPMLEMNRRALESVLEQVRDKPVCVISVAGEARQGKSFLLCFLLRCLEYSNLSETDNDWMQWEDDQVSLKGFAWRNGVERETAGFWLWNTPFTIKKDDGTEVAVLLMDTEGELVEFNRNSELSVDPLIDCACRCF